jgi:translation initiation factor eIF-2B subunit delta
MRLCAQDYATPEGRVLSRDLTHVLNGAIAFLVECRPLSVPMGNAIKALKLQARARLTRHLQSSPTYLPAGGFFFLAWQGRDAITAHSVHQM